jgi:hypothetical protein
MNGQLVSSKSYGKTASGIFLFPVNQPSGSYILELNHGNKSENVKIIVR